MVATSSSNAFEWWSSVLAPGCCASSLSRMCCASRTGFINYPGCFPPADPQRRHSRGPHDPRSVPAGALVARLMDRAGSLVPADVAVRFREYTPMFLERGNQVGHELDRNNNF